MIDRWREITLLILLVIIGVNATSSHENEYAPDCYGGGTVTATSSQGCECKRYTSGSYSIDCRNKGLNDSRIVFDECKSPDSLILSNNDIVDLDAKLVLNKDQRRKIRYLYLENSNVEYMSKDLLVEFPNLVSLSLNDNKLGKDAEYIYFYFQSLLNAPNKLKDLDLSNNSLPSLPVTTFAKRSPMQDLTLSNNPNMFDGGLYYVFNDKLQSLNLKNCNLTQLRFNFEEMTSLTDLYLSNNKLTEKSIREVEKLRNLMTLYLDGNPIESLDQGWLMSTKIWHLSLSNMPKLQTIGANAFTDLPKLSILNLSGSKQLHTIDKRAFGHDGTNYWITKVEMDLRNCSLTTLPKDLLNWNTVEKLYIGGNPWDCNEHIRWLIDNKNIKLDRKKPFGVCATPPELKNRRIQDIRNIQNFIEPPLSTKSPKEPIQKTTSFSWLKRRRATTDSQTRVPFHGTTESPESGHTPLTQQIIAKFRELFLLARNYSKRPTTNFAGGFVVGVFAMVTLYLLIKLAIRLVRLVCFLLSEYVLPHIINFCQTFGPPLGRFIVAVLYAILAMARACLELCRKKYYSYIGYKHQHNVETVSSLIDDTEKQATKTPTTPTHPETVLVYNRNEEHATIVQ